MNGKPRKTRNTGAVAAWNRTGAGKHGDRRTKRNRDRSAQRRNAINEGR